MWIGCRAFINPLPPAQQQEGSSSEQFQLLQEIFPPTYPRPQNLGYSSPRPFHGNCFRSRSKWGEDRRLRWRVTGPLSGEVLSKGSPAGTTTGVCWTSTSKGAFGSGGEPQVQPNVPRPPKRNGRDQKTPDGRSSDRILFLPQDALRRPPVFPTMQAMARLRMRAWQGGVVQNAS